MIAEFERRLADVLGTRLLPPWKGRVSVAPAPAAEAEPRHVIAVASTEVLEPDLGSRRLQVTPGSADQRRVVRLRCKVRVDVQSGTVGGRARQIEALDAALYLLDAPDLRDGSALASGGDSGFLIQSLHLTGSTSPQDPAAVNAPDFGLVFEATGWFWPVGVAGQAGRQIGEIRIRGVVLPVTVEPADPVLAAGGPAANLTVKLRAAGVMRGQGQPALPLGRLALALVGPGGRPGSGVLAGGDDGGGGTRLVSVVGGEATVSYTPPAQAARDELVIALEDGQGGAGVEFGRFPLVVRGA